MNGTAGVSTAIKTILAPMDFSPSSLQTVTAAAELALAVGGSVVVMTAIPPWTPSDADEPSLDQRLETMRMQLAHWYVAHVAPTLATRPATRFLALSGTPVDAIVEAATREKADLIVMATHGRVGLDRLLHPSVAEAVLHRGPTPVLLMRTDATSRTPVAA